MKVTQDNVTRINNKNVKIIILQINFHKMKAHSNRDR